MRLEVDNYIGVGEASGILGSSRQAVYDWIGAGRLNYSVIGKRILLLRSDVEKFAIERLAAQRQAK